MAQGKPVIFAGEMSHDYVKLAEAGISTDASAASLAEAIVRLASTDVDGRRRMGRNARDYVEQNHDMGVLVDRLQPVL